MHKIFSKTEPEKLLHFVTEIPTQKSRAELIEVDNYLQLSTLNLSEGQTFASHAHLWKELESNLSLAQEAWVVISGKVEATYFDLDDKYLEKVIIGPGQVSVTLFGGHGYRILEDTMAFEFKSGPYLGQALDKRFIGPESIN